MGEKPRKEVKGQQIGLPRISVLPETISEALTSFPGGERSPHRCNSWLGGSTGLPCHLRLQCFFLEEEGKAGQNPGLLPTMRSELSVPQGCMHWPEPTQTTGIPARSKCQRFTPHL